MTAAIAGLGGSAVRLRHGRHRRALLFITPDFHLTSFESGMVVGAVPIGAVLGAAFAGRLSDAYGRRILIIALVDRLRRRLADLRGGPRNRRCWSIARVILGVAIGLASATAPVYISEVAPPDIRGRLVTFFQLAVTIGIVVAYVVGLAFDSSEEWRWMLGLGAVPAFFLFAGMLKMPQSPRWLVMAGRDFEARAVLRESRGRRHAIEQEIVDIEGEVSAEPGKLARSVGSRAPDGPRSSGVGLAILQQVSGINTVIYYAPTIVQLYRLRRLQRGDPGLDRGRDRQRRHDPGRDPAARPGWTAAVAPVGSA